MTLREVAADHADVDSSHFVRSRRIKITIMQAGRGPYTAIELYVIPSSTPIDHTFRYYEPQNSHATLYVPPFLQFF